MQVVFLGLEDEKKLVRRELEKGCSCHEACYSNFTEDEIYSVSLSMHELQKSEKDVLLLGKLQVCANASSVTQHARQAKCAKRRRVTYKYAYDSR